MDACARSWQPTLLVLKVFHSGSKADLADKIRSRKSCSGDRIRIICHVGRV